VLPPRQGAETREVMPLTPDPVTDVSTFQQDPRVVAGMEPTAAPVDGAAALALATARPAWIARFLVFDELGVGGMGRVYAAYDPELDRKVALKLVHHHDSVDSKARLQREAQAMARLSHPNVVTVYEVGSHARQLFIAMELVVGENLAAWLAAETRPWRAVLAVFRAAGEGLAAAHDAGLVHRDFKPANVLVGADGRARVADFGLVHAREATPDGAADAARGSQALTWAGAVMGTPAYMAPEQLRGEPTDARTDVFSFCLALWEALYGARPFAGATMEERQQAIERGLPDDPPRSSARDRWLRPLLRRGLAAEPARRWPGMRPLLAALARDPELERSRRRRRVLVTIAVLVMGGALVFGGSALWSSVQTRARERAATSQLEAALARAAQLQAEGSDDEAALVVDGFVAAPEHAGTRALVQALRRRADDRQRHGDQEGAIDAYSQAYAAAEHPDEIAESLLGLARLFRARSEWAPLTWVLASLEATAVATPVEVKTMQRDAALYRRDFVAAARHDDAGARLFAALGQAQASEHRALRAEAIDLEGDGVRSVILWETLAGESNVTIVRAAPGLPALASFMPRGTDSALHHVVPGTAPEPGRIIGGQRRMLIWDGRGFVVEKAWGRAHALATTSADLDQDGVREVYVGVGRRGRRLLGLRAGPRGWDTFTPAPDLDAADSDVQALTVGDLDGDGREELVAALGPPLAHDLRVLRAGAPGGPLVQVVRRKHGAVVDLRLVPTPDGPLLAVASVIPAGGSGPTGAIDDPPAGLHLYRLRDDELHEVAAYPSAPGTRLQQVVVADLDGDRWPELLGEVQQEVQPGPRHLEIFRPEAAGGRLQIGELIPLLAVNLDDDPADELLVADARDRSRVWALGVGAAALPGLELGHPERAAPPAELAVDPPLRAQWERAEVLAGLGLLTNASRRHAELGRSLTHGPGRGATLARAADLASQAGDLAGAAALFEAAAVDDRRWLARATANYERLGRLDDAIRTLRALGAEDPAIASSLARHEQFLRSEQALRFDQPLDPAWQVFDPLVVRHDPLRAVLVVDMLNPDPVLALPVVLDADFVVRVELSLAEVGLGGSFGFALAPGKQADRPLQPIVAVATGASGEPGARLAIGFRLEEQAADIPLPAPGARLMIELSHLASRGEQRLTVRVDGVAVGDVRRPIVRDLAGPVSLRFMRGLKPSGITSPWSRIELHRITTRGVTIRAPGTDPWATARLGLVESDGEAALAALDAAHADGEAPPELPVWRALALFRAGRDGEAASLLRTSLDLRARTAPVYLAAIRMLGARPELTSLLRGALGPGYLQLFWDTWSPLAARDLRRPKVLRAVAEHSPALDLAVAADAPGLDLPFADVVVLLRSLRAAVFIALNQPARARRELAVLDIQQAARNRDARAVLTTSLARLAAQELADGHVDEAFARLDALAQVCAPEIFVDLVRAQPGLWSLRADPRWRRLPGADPDQASLQYQCSQCEPPPDEAAAEP
jgi:tRNA A-37 threonylcarbamoyl transferase component Bud32